MQLIYGPLHIEVYSGNNLGLEKMWPGKVESWN